MTSKPKIKRSSVFAAVFVLLFTLLAGKAAGGITGVDGVNVGEVIKSIQEQIDYIAGRHFVEPHLLLESIDVDLTLVGSETKEGGLTFKIVFFEIGGKTKIINSVTTTTHLTLKPSSFLTFSKSLIPFDKFLVEQLQQIKSGLRATSFLPKLIRISIEFVVQKEAGGSAGAKGFSFLSLINVGAGVDATALRQRTQKITFYFKQK